MIGISFSRKDFEYDAYTLIKAFYPKEDVVTFYEGDEKEKDTYSFLVRILYEEDCTTILFEKESNCIFQETVHFPEEEERKERKNRLKQALYRGLTQETGKTLPWGNLTGIRPTKIAMSLIESGMSNVQAADYMRNTYYTSNEKTALAITIANRERELLKE